MEHNHDYLNGMLKSELVGVRTNQSKVKSLSKPPNAYAPPNSYSNVFSSMESIVGTGTVFLIFFKNIDNKYT